jgi:hypothetical protein
MTGRADFQSIVRKLYYFSFWGRIEAYPSHAVWPAMRNNFFQSTHLQRNQAIFFDKHDFKVKIVAKNIRNFTLTDSPPRDNIAT